MRQPFDPRPFPPDEGGGGWDGDDWASAIFGLILLVYLAIQLGLWR